MSAVKIDLVSGGRAKTEMAVQGFAASADGIVAQRIAEVRTRFLDTMDERIDEIDAARQQLARLGAHPGSHTAVTDVIRFGSHKISGIALTLGFMDLGRLAQTTELTVQRFDAEPGSTSPEMLFDTIDDLLGEMALLLAENGRA